MTIAIDWDVKHETKPKQKKSSNLSDFYSKTLNYVLQEMIFDIMEHITEMLKISLTNGLVHH